MTLDKYNPEVGEIWWSNTCKKHWFFLKKEEAVGDMKGYKWRYTMLRLEDGQEDSIYHGAMNAHGEGWFKRIS